MTLSPKLKIPVWIGVWILTRGLILAQVGLWNTAGPEYQDVNVFEAWSNFIVENHKLPIEDSWQYPPGAAFLMLLPRLGGGGHFGISFVITMLLVDLIGLALVARLAKRQRRDLGVWVWLLAMPLLFSLPVLRFDLVPTVIAIAALVVIHRRPGWFGALVGLGAMVKVWPVFVLFGEWDRRRLVKAAAAALAVVVGIFLISAVAFGSQTGFLTNQQHRGLQVEAVAATPWQLRAAITGKEPPTVLRFGTNEIGSDLADAVATLLDLAAALVLIAAATWWWMRDRAIRQGRRDLADVVLSRDFVFTVLLLFVVTSRVLSPQYLIWLVGLCAVVLTSYKTRLERPAWVVIGAVALSVGIYASPASMVIRNVALLFAAIDASVTIFLALRRVTPVAGPATVAPDAAPTLGKAPT